VDAVFGLIRDIAVGGSIGLLLWGAVICLRELYESMSATRLANSREAREDSGRWIAASRTQGG
jgi:hypothetical protein